MVVLEKFNYLLGRMFIWLTSCLHRLDCSLYNASSDLDHRASNLLNNLLAKIWSQHSQNESQTLVQGTKLKGLDEIISQLYLFLIQLGKMKFMHNFYSGKEINVSR